MPKTMLAALACLAAAALPAAAADGYVVKAESGSVYLDLGAGSGAEAGRPFTVFTEGEELVHPVSGKGLGRIEKRVAAGTIREVAPAYSVGTLLDGAAPVAPGQRVRL
ncbi:MAG: hypothetical protein HY554_03465, partial [Elusimicrobia bacterium]|nr:hypothetical protein [Elusimicrobiota bacterium]